MKFNSIKINGDNNIVLQGADGSVVTQALEDFIRPFMRDKDELIERLTSAVNDKEVIQSLSSDKILRLSKELRQALEEKALLAVQLEEMVQDFSQKDITKSGDLYQQAFNSFVSADVNKALELLNEEDLEETLTEIERTERESSEQRRNLASNFVLKAKMLQLQSDFGGAGKSFEKAASISSEWEYFIETGKFFDFVKDYKKAEYYGSKALEVSETAYQRALALNNLANLYIDTEDYGKARSSLIESIEIRRKLTECKSETSYSDLANSLNSLSALQRDLAEFDEAEKNLREALDIRKRLANDNPIVDKFDEYRPNVAMLRANLASVLVMKHQFDRAEANFNSALRIYEMVNGFGTEAHLPNIAMILLNLGNLHLLKFELVKAEFDYGSALNIWRKLSETNPQTYTPDVARALNSLALLQIEKKDFESANTNAVESLTIYRKLAASDPRAYSTDLANAFITIASSQIHMDELDKAEITYKEALSTIQEDELNHDQCLRIASDIYQHVAELQKVKNELESANVSLSRALDMRRKLSKISTQAYSGDVGDTLCRLAGLERQQRNLASANKNYREALLIFRSLAQSNVDVYKANIAAINWQLAEVLREQNALDEAEGFFKEALREFQFLSEINPNVHMPHTARVQSSLALLQKECGALEKAEANYQAALAIFKRLDETDPRNYRGDILTSLNNIANIQRDTNKLEAANDTYVLAMKLLDEGFEASSIESALLVVVILSNVGVFYTYLLPDKEKAIKAAKDGISNALPYESASPIALQAINSAKSVLHEWENK